VILELLDPHTLRLRVEAPHCDTLRLAFDDGRVVELRLVRCGG
jgi:hypothetical protein